MRLFFLVLYQQTNGVGGDAFLGARKAQLFLGGGFHVDSVSGGVEDTGKILEFIKALAEYERAHAFLLGGGC